MINCFKQLAHKRFRCFSKMFTAVVPVPADPPVNRATTDAENGGYIGDRVPTVELEQGERATVGAEIVGGAKQSPELEPLLGCQMKGHDGLPHDEGSHG